MDSISNKLSKELSQALADKVNPNQTQFITNSEQFNPLNKT